MNRVKCREFTVEINGKFVTAEVEVSVVFEIDGADADGNRGRPVSYIDEIGFTVSETDPVWNQSDDEESLTPEEVKEVQAMLLKEAKGFDWATEILDDEADRANYRD